MTLAMIAEISKKFRDERGLMQLFSLLAKHDVPGRLAIRLWTVYHEAIFSILRTNPYRLAFDVC